MNTDQRQIWTRRIWSLLWMATFVYAMFMTLDFRHRGPRSIIWSDAEGYYMYLPAVFIYGGFEDIPLNTDTGQFRNYPGTNKIFDKYTYGVAVFELPFFLAAHLTARLSDEYPADGHSLPYVYAIMMAGLFYGAIGILLLRRNLRHYFGGIIPDVIALSVLLGTNLLHYIVRAPGMSHVYSFLLFNVFIWLTHRYYRRNGPWSPAIALALVWGWTVLIRPTNALLGLYLLFYIPEGGMLWRDRLAFFRRRFGQLLLFPLMAFVAFIPQMFYWHYMTGQYIFYSYRDESFIYWAEPRLGPVLFSIKNGWLFYSPLMGIALIGMMAGAWRNLVNSRVILVIWLLAWYAFASWKSWWFGGAFGHRAFIEFYALLALPLALVVQWILQRRWWWQTLFFALWLLLIYYSLGLTDHYRGPHYEWYSWRNAMKMMFTW